MMKQFLRRALLSSILFGCGSIQVNAADVAADSNKVKIQRSFVNLDFSQPQQTVPYRQISQDLVSGWKTTHRVYNGSRIIEIWRGTGFAQMMSTTAADNQYAELNAEEASALYQNVCLFRGETFNWSFAHSTRANKNETSRFYLGTVDTSAASAKHTATLVQLIGNSPTHTIINTWKTASGTATVGNGVPEKGGIYSFLFEATGSATTVGNFLDDIKIGLKPAVEFSASSGNFYEDKEDKAGKTHSVPFNIVGQILSQSDMPTLQFKIEYPAAYAQSKAVYGKNYRLYKQVGSGLVELAATDGLNTSNPDKITFNYTPVYNAALDYTKGVQVNDLVIKIFGNTQVNDDMTLPFEFALNTSSQAVATNLRTCGNAIADVKFDLLIQEDDIDLAVVKTLKPESIILKNHLVSYQLDVSNNAAVQADGVLLRDNFQNLTRVITGDVAHQTSLVCEDLSSGTSKTCPATWTDATALTALFNSTAGSGLSLGNIPAHAKYRFTVNNLQVMDIDQTSIGYAVNTATVETTKMFDFDSTNNTSTVKSLILAKSDLSNNVASSSATETGTGLFNITKEGRAGTTALLTKHSDLSQKAYFPLNIQNDSQLEQDYQLYASSTAVTPTLATGDYSTLLKAGITPFTSGLKVEFFSTDAAQCKAGISTQQITQLKVAANTLGQVCAVVTILPSAPLKTNLWFAMESLQSGLGDVIMDAVGSDHLQQRLLELVNDQAVQINIGGTYVFSHRLFNHGTVEEKGIKLKIAPVRTDDFLYTLFEDINQNGILDTVDTMISEQSFSILANAELALLIKVQAPATAVNGMTSQVKLEVIPENHGQTTMLSVLSNVDSITVGSNQLKILKTQFKRAGCLAMNAASINSAVYSVKSVTIAATDCLVYRITVTNMGDSKLSNVVVNDMYPAYTLPWESDSVLPMTSSGEVVQADRAKVTSIFSTLLPQEEKSLYFGIKMQ